MKHQIDWDHAHDCVRLVLDGPFLLDDARVLMDRLELLVDGKPHKRLLVDHTASPSTVPRDTREFLLVRTAALQLDQIAFFGTTNLTRIAAKIILAVTGKAERSAFFKSEAEAIAWFERSRDALAS